MVLDQTANFVRGTVSASIASGDTTISVTDASIYPDPANGDYNLVLWDTNQGRPDQDSAVEIVRVTGRDTGTDTLTVTRGQEGTSAASHPDSSALLLDATDKLLSDVDTSLEEIADFAASPTEVTAPVNNDSVDTQSGSFSESLELSKADRSHWSPRSFEFSGPPMVAPHPVASNPELTQSDAGANADEVADPFIVFDPSDGQFHLFFEELLDSGDENIGHATSPDGISWTYDTTVIDDTDHKAYPFVFKWSGEWYMTPDPGGGNDFDIWQADSFPGSWSIAETPITQSGAGHDLVDPTPIFWNNRWFIFFNDAGTDSKHLWYADSTGPAFTGRSWSEHPSSPVVSGDATLARNAGRPIPKQNFIDFFSQNDTDRTLRAHRITTLSTSAFEWSELSTSPIAQGTGYGWAETDIHHIDMLMPFVGGPSIAIVDGRSAAPEWSIGVYTLSEKPRTVFRLALTGSNQTGLRDTVFETVGFNTKQYDYNGDANATTGKFSVPRNGIYFVSTNARIIPGANQDYRVIIRLQNETDLQNVVANDAQVTSTDDAGVQAAGLALLEAGKTYRVQFWHNAGEQIAIEASGSNGNGQYSRLDVIGLY